MEKIVYAFAGCFTFSFGALIFMLNVKTSIE